MTLEGFLRDSDLIGFQDIDPDRAARQTLQTQRNKTIRTVRTGRETVLAVRVVVGD